ncbi:MAG: hypothetical protein HRT36_00945 [Alphaproteobacteria bacterium]|nr:hypothetical protein [Alphaproteobacteria bacterium]
MTPLRDTVDFHKTGVDHQRRKISILAGPRLENPFKDTTAFVAIIEHLDHIPQEHRTEDTPLLQAKDDTDYLATMARFCRFPKPIIHRHENLINLLMWY